MTVIISSAPNGMSIYRAGNDAKGAKGAAVATPCQAYEKMATVWQLVDALWGGTRAMREPGNSKRFLPSFEAESQPDYQKRVNQAVLTNYYRRTIKSAVGKVFQKPLTLDDKVPPVIAGGTGESEGLQANIDSYGNDVNAFARDFTEALVHYGFSHILVDWPQLDAEQQAQLANPLNGGQRVERDMGVRPYWVHVKPTDVIGWQAEVRSGKWVLTQLRIKETVEVKDPENEFATTCVQRVRVYDIGRIRVYELRKDAVSKQEEWVNIADAPMMLRGKPWTRIPFVTAYANRTDYMQAEPMLEGLAHLNVAHYQSDSDQRNILHVARVPLLFYKGSTNEDNAENFELKLGAGSVTKGGPDSDLKYVEHTGAAIEAGDKDLANLEVRMAEMALGLVTRSDPANPTATAKSIDSAEANSPLHVAALGTQDAIDEALDLTAQWMGLGEKRGGTCKVNTDFGIGQAEASQMQELAKARTSGDLSRETFWAELVRRGYLSDSFDPKKEAALIETEGPPMSMNFGAGLDANGDPIKPPVDADADDPDDSSPSTKVKGKPPAAAKPAFGGAA